MKKFKILDKCLLILFLFSQYNLNVYAETYPAYGKYKLTWNIQKIYYYIDNTATGYSGTIASAADNWVHTGIGYNKLYPNTRTYNKKNSAVDVYAEYYGNASFVASTYTYMKKNGVTSFVEWVGVPGRAPGTGIPSANYSYTEIHINNDIFDNYTNFELRKAVIVHEFGHCWGLGHNYENEYSIMNGYDDSRKVYTVQKVDNKIFNILYK